jgi:HlyD family secretion protein
VQEISTSSQNSQAGIATSQNSSSDEVANFLVKISISDRDPRLRPGMSSTTEIQTQTVENVIVVPIQSVTVRADDGKTIEDLQEEKNKEAKEKSGNDLEVTDDRSTARDSRDMVDRVVFVVDGTKVRVQKVKTGIADNTNIEIKEGLKDGDVVVSGSYAAISRKLKNDSTISIEEPKKDKK